MTFSIDFSARDTSRKSVNDNIHDPEFWGYAYALAENSTPINKWPIQFTVHYIYECMNRPWLSEHQRLHELTQWLQQEAPDLQLKV